MAEPVTPIHVRQGTYLALSMRGGLMISACHDCLARLVENGYGCSRVTRGGSAQCVSCLTGKGDWWEIDLVRKPPDLPVMKGTAGATTPIQRREGMDDDRRNCED